MRKLLLLVLGMYGFVASHAIAEPNWTRYSDCAGGQVISKGCQSQYSAAFPSEPKRSIIPKGRDDYSDIATMVAVQGRQTFLAGAVELPSNDFSDADSALDQLAQTLAAPHHCTSHSEDDLVLVEGVGREIKLTRCAGGKSIEARAYLMKNAMYVVGVINEPPILPEMGHNTLDFLNSFQFE